MLMLAYLKREHIAIAKTKDYVDWELFGRMDSDLSCAT
jgi:hypothetical protein